MIIVKTVTNGRDFSAPLSICLCIFIWCSVVF